MLTALIIDDEYLARRRVEKLLETHTDVQVLGEAKNGQEAVELIQYKSPDLIFLDVEMPDFGGFEVIKKLRQNTAIPYLIFTTDRKSTRLNSSHQIISYAVFCLKKKKT